MKRGLICTVFFTITLFGCKNKNSGPANGILNRQQMQAVLWDVMQADVFANRFIKKDSSKNPVLEDAKLQQQIFDLHHVTKDEFYNSYAYYKEHSSLMEEMLDSLIATKERERRNQLDKQSQIKNKLFNAKSIKPR